MEIAEQIELLTSPNNLVACQALKNLEKLSNQSEEVYQYMEHFLDLISHANSYVRTRGLLLLAYNSKWDKKGLFESIIEKYLQHIVDIKPITARQCIKVLPLIAHNKPSLKQVIIRALRKADTSAYPDSMRSLVDKDIQKALQELA